MGVPRPGGSRSGVLDRRTPGASCASVGGRAHVSHGHRRWARSRAPGCGQARRRPPCWPSRCELEVRGGLHCWSPPHVVLLPVPRLSRPSAWSLHVREHLPASRKPIYRSFRRSPETVTSPCPKVRPRRPLAAPPRAPRRRRPGRRGRAPGRRSARAWPHRPRDQRQLAARRRTAGGDRLERRVGEDDVGGHRVGLRPGQPPGAQPVVEALVVGRRAVVAAAALAVGAAWPGAAAGWQSVDRPVGRGLGAARPAYGERRNRASSRAQAVEEPRGRRLRLPPGAAGPRPTTGRGARGPG